ncbi:conserved hypothetical protein, partial [Ixodes scapularis]
KSLFTTFAQCGTRDCISYYAPRALASSGTTVSPLETRATCERYRITQRRLACVKYIFETFFPRQNNFFADQLILVLSLRIKRSFFFCFFFLWRTSPVFFADTSRRCAPAFGAAPWPPCGLNCSFMMVLMFLLYPYSKNKSCSFVLHCFNSIDMRTKRIPNSTKIFSLVITVIVFFFFLYSLLALDVICSMCAFQVSSPLPLQVQFIAIFVHSFQLLFRPDCNYPRGFMWWIGFHAIMFWFLFWDFYKNTYFAKRLKGAALGRSATANGRAASNGTANGTNGYLKHASNGRNGGFLDGYCQ